LGALNPRTKHEKFMIFAILTDIDFVVVIGSGFGGTPSTECRTDKGRLNKSVLDLSDVGFPPSCNSVSRCMFRLLTIASEVRAGVVHAVLPRWWLLIKPSECVMNEWVWITLGQIQVMRFV